MSPSNATQAPASTPGLSSFQGADLELARQWLAEAARLANLGAVSDEFIDRVFRRLEKGAREYGSDNYLRAAIEELMGETAEEGDDIAGWALVTAMRIYSEAEGAELDLRDQAQLIQDRLLRAAAWGLRAWMEMREARALVEDLAIRSPDPHHE